MPQLQGFNVWVEMEGVRLEEYKTETNQDNTRIVSWIPCESGKTFRICCTLPYERQIATNHKIQVILDGKEVAVPGVVDKNLTPTEAPPRYLSHESVNEGTGVRPFQFGNIELTDDETYFDGTSKAFGEMVISISSVQMFVPIDGAIPKRRKDEYKIHERSKKGLAHCIKYGETQVLPRAQSYVKSVGDNLLCTFVFKYRHMDILLANDIAPPKARTDSPVNNSSSAGSSSGSGIKGNGNGNANASGSKRKIDRVKSEEGEAGRIDDIIDMTGDEDLEIQALEAKLAALKEKKSQGGHGGRSLKRVKKEAKSTLVSGEVIDLTL